MVTFAPENALALQFTGSLNFDVNMYSCSCLKFRQFVDLTVVTKLLLDSELTGALLRHC